jgi:photosystem II CP47 chlorophyll apoprotein
LAHVFLSGLLVLASFWHWAFWDLDLFVSELSYCLVLDLNKIFGIHLLLSAILCFGFGYGHLSGLAGPGFWTSDSFGLLGSVRVVKPVFNVISAQSTTFGYGVILAHHIVSGLFGILAALWHISSRPGPFVYSLLAMSNIESVLSSSISAVFFTGFVNSALMWYSSSSTPIELFGPTRYHWDNGYFSQDIEGRVKSALKSTAEIYSAWEQVPDKLVLYDYIGCNPSKGGLFRSGPMVKGDGVVQN